MHRRNAVRSVGLVISKSDPEKSPRTTKRMPFNFIQKGSVRSFMGADVDMAGRVWRSICRERTAQLLNHGGHGDHGEDETTKRAKDAKVRCILYCGRRDAAC